MLGDAKVIQMDGDVLKGIKSIGLTENIKLS
jgi:hypothetical protein